MPDINIYVGNMPFEVTEEEIQELFAQHGEVRKVKLITNRDTGKPRGFSFVEMEREAGEAAIEALNGHQLGDRALRVNEARPRR